MLFPKWFGTVDRFVVEALPEVPSLPETQKLLRMKPKSLTDDDAVVLIDILRKEGRTTERTVPHRRMDSAKDRHDSLESA